MDITAGRALFKVCRCTSATPQVHQLLWLHSLEMCSGHKRPGNVQWPQKRADTGKLDEGKLRSRVGQHTTSTMNPMLTSSSSAAPDVEAAPAPSAADGPPASPPLLVPAAAASAAGLALRLSPSSSASAARSSSICCLTSCSCASVLRTATSSPV